MDFRVFWMIFFVVFFESLIAVAESPESVDWCEIEEKYCRGSPHIGCFDPETDEYYCPHVRIINIPEEGKRQILNQYNKYRNQFAGGLSPEVPIQASRMMRVEWSDSLENLSQIAIRRCKEKPPLCFVGDRGQLLFAFSRDIRNSLNLDDLNAYKLFEFDQGTEMYIENFLYELKNNNVEIEVNETDVTLTILVSFRVLNLEEDMNEVGCALGEFFNEKDNGRKTVKLYCHTLYNKNSRTQLVQSFKPGPPCSECIEGQECSKEYPNLCESSNFVENSKNSSQLYIIIIIGCIIFFIFIVILVILLFRKYSARLRNHFCPRGGFSALRQYECFEMYSK